MNVMFRITFWIFIFCTIKSFTSQETEDYIDTESMNPEYFQLINGEPLLLNKSYCLEQISAEIISGNLYDEHNKSLYYIKIMWTSSNFMTSINVESDSVNDSYCEAENKHYYNRKPLNQSVHVFPDDVNEGIRFLPIKLDCKFIITPELEGLCRPLKFKYSTPVCIDNDTCSCRNVFIPSPVIKTELENDGINVIWSFPKDFKDNVTKIFISIYVEDGINIKKVTGRSVPVQHVNNINEVQFKEFFQINVTDMSNYRIQGYFENKLSCPGNSTLILFRHTGIVRKIKYEKVASYVIAFGFVVVLVVIILSFAGKTQFKRIWMKLFSPETLELPDVEYLTNDNNHKCYKLPQMVYNPTYVESSRDSYWFDYRDLEIVREIASGNFGVVYLAYSSTSLKGCNEFAIKQIKESAGSEGLSDFLEEINTFKLVGSHPNVVRMFGYCTAPQPLTIIMEYIPFNLLIYLKNLRVNFEKRKAAASSSGRSISYAKLSHSRSCSSLDYNYISHDEIESIPLRCPRNILDDNELEYVLDNRELEAFGLQIAKGMAHLESRNIIHRDLAARNILMDNFKNLKISDFGMSKTGIYVNKRTKKLPLRWMSPEAVVSRTFSNKSDVWSFGVVLWEIGTLGTFPYPSLQNEEVIMLLESGGHLDKPENVSAHLYKVMVHCWARLPSDRPTFKDLVKELEVFRDKSSLEPSYVFPEILDDKKENDKFCEN